MTTLAEVLQSFFVFSIIVLAAWRVFRPAAENWHAWLRVCVTLGICGGLLGAVVVAGSLLRQYDPSSGEAFERSALITRWTGPYWWSFWGRPVSLLILSGLLFVARRRSSWWIAWAMALLLSIPLGLLIIAVTSLHQDYLPSSASSFHQGWSALAIPVMLLFSAGLMVRAQRRALNTRMSRKN